MNISSYLINISSQPFPKQRILDPSKLKSLQTTIPNLTKMADSFPDGKKTLWEKEKLLVTSNFFFSHCVLKRL